MAKRKQEVQLQQEIETQEDWEEFLKKPGLLGMLVNFKTFKVKLIFIYNSEYPFFSGRSISRMVRAMPFYSEPFEKNQDGKFRIRSD